MAELGLERLLAVSHFMLEGRRIQLSQVKVMHRVPANLDQP